MNVQEILTTYIKDGRQLDYFLGAEAETVRTLNGRILNSPPTQIHNDTFVQVSFSKQQVLDRTATQKAGEPVYIEYEMVTTRLPQTGDYQFPRVNHNRVAPKHIFRFPKEYEAFKKGESKEVGTPLSEISIPADIAEKLKSYGYTTVERLATADMSIASKIPTLNTFKAHAEEYLRNKPAADVDKKLAAQEETIKKLTEQLNAVTKLLEKTAEREAKKNKE